MSDWRVVRRRGFWPRVSADIHALAEKQRQQLLTREDMAKLRSIPWRGDTFEPGDDTKSVFDMLAIILKQLPDEGYKLFPWVVREVKRGYMSESPFRGEEEFGPGQGINYRNLNHALDILNQAIKWFVWSYEHNKPLPDYMQKTFGFPSMQSWVYEMNSRDVDLSDGIHWHDSTPVFAFEDGWHIDDVGANDLAQEGELMGHCVGGYCNDVNRGNSSIFSLRDPKGQPHVTVEFAGDVHNDVTKGYGQVETPSRELNIVQEQGKSDSTPIPEYQQRLDEWYDHLRAGGWEVSHDSGEYGIENAEDVEYWDDTDVYPPTHQGIETFYHHLRSDPWRFEQDEDPEYNQDRGRWTRTERVPNFIAHPTATWTHPETGETHPRSADAEHLLEPLKETLQYLWSRPYNDEEAEEFAQAYFAAIHHTNLRSHVQNDRQAMDELVSTASEWIAQKRSQRPQPKPNTPTLFEPDDFFEQRALPRSVQTFMHYLTAYQAASQEAPRDNALKNQFGHEYVGDYPNGSYVPRMIPRMPGDWPVTKFPDYFNMLESQAPEYFNRDWLDQLSTTSHLLDHLQRIASGNYPQCPFDQNELDLHFHGGASCPSCGSEFELGRNGEIIPSDDSVWAQTQQWPNTIPEHWGSLSTGT